MKKFKGYLPYTPALVIYLFVAGLGYDNLVALLIISGFWAE